MTKAQANRCAERILQYYERRGQTVEVVLRRQVLTYKGSQPFEEWSAVMVDPKVRYER